MTTFVLVHGSNGGGWVWQKLAPLLRGAGHDVFAPTLSGLADRAHLLQCGVNLTTHITDIASLLFYEDLSEVVLVGNSYAGMVITGVAAKVPERLKLVVYLDAYVPADGQSEADLLPPQMRAAREADAAAHNGLTEPPPPGIFGVTEPALTAWVLARVTPHPWSTYAEPVSAGNERSAGLRRVFIHCTGKPANVPDPFIASAAAARALGWRFYTLAAGHLAMLTAPRELAALLLEVAGSTTK
jgi:pimeloyl-ACP methyl ester carboxylesterase